MCLRIKLIQGIGMLLKQGILQLVGVVSTVDLLVYQSSLPSYLQHTRARGHVGDRQQHTCRENDIKSCFLVKIFGHRQCNIQRRVFTTNYTRRGHQKKVLVAHACQQKLRPLLCFCAPWALWFCRSAPSEIYVRQRRTGACLAETLCLSSIFQSTTLFTFYCHFMTWHSPINISPKSALFIWIGAGFRSDFNYWRRQWAMRRCEHYRRITTSFIWPCLPCRDWSVWIANGGKTMTSAIASKIFCAPEVIRNKW